MNDLHRQVELLMENWTEHSKTGMHVRMLVGPDDADYFKGCPQGQRFVAMMIRLTDDDTPAAPPTPDEVAKEVKKRTARGVAEAGGTVVDQATFDKTIEDAFPDKKPAKELAILKDNGGSVLGVAFKKEPANQAAKQAAKFPDGLTGLAVRWCADEHFQTWLSQSYPVEWDARVGVPPNEISKAIICNLCGITTRKELDSSVSAGHIFRHDILQPYAAIRKEDRVDNDAPF